MSTLVIPKSKEGSLLGYSAFLNSLNLSDVQKPKIKEVTKVISVASDSKSAEDSDKMNDFLDAEIKALKNLNFSKAKHLSKVVASTNENISKIDDFFCFIQGFEVDDKHVVTVMKNLAKAKEKLSYISDYLSTAMEIQIAKEEIVKSKKLTFEELKKKLTATK